MKYRNSCFSRLFHGTNTIEIGPESINVRSAANEIEIAYSDIHKIQIEPGFIWSHLSLTGPDLCCSTSGFSASTLGEIRTRLTSNTGNYLISLLENSPSTLQALQKEIPRITNSDRFISKKNLHRRLSKFKKINTILNHPLVDFSHIDKPLRLLLQTLHALTVPESQLLKQLNDKHVESALQKHKELFDGVEKNPLTDEQRRSAIVDEDSNLIIAAAGSGKSSTIVGKAMYLLASGLATTDEILVLTYNNEAQK
ncbi:MAG TPA: hypothetical protein EYQ00_14980, partial [Dehalococcoidia bacterium]|nr:hypothetical protein [Dehalococcoidia bacterium]